jgi:uncharacterized coiled-coil protein SlyX
MIQMKKLPSHYNKLRFNQSERLFSFLYSKVMATNEFENLLKNSFENGSIQPQYLEELMRCIVSKLSDTSINLVDYEDANEAETLVEARIEEVIINHDNESDNSINEWVEMDATLGSKRATHLHQLPSMKKFPRFTYKGQSTDRELDIVCKLEDRIDEVNSTISQNQFFLQQQICELQNQMRDVEEKMKDLFYACEQNEEKVEETDKSISDFNRQIFCLKSDVKVLLNDSQACKEKMFKLEETCENLEVTKAGKAELVALRDAFFSELKLFTCLGDFNDECDRTRLHEAASDAIFAKFETEVKKTVRCLKVMLDEKMEKDALAKFKNITTMLFEQFINDLKSQMLNILNNATKYGTSTALSCLCCDSKLSSLQKEFSALDKAADRFKFFVNKTPVPKKDYSRVNHFCHRKKNVTKSKNEETRNFSCHTKESLLSFPNTRQCFIISKDNAIFKADPIKCLRNPNYSKL